MRPDYDGNGGGIHRLSAILNMMRCRATRIALLAFEALWLNVIVPGHSRGAVGLPGESCPLCPAVAVSSDSVTPKCCDRGSTPDSRDSHPARDPAAHCSICHFAARATPPPVIDFTPPKPEILAIRPTASMSALYSRPPAPTYLGRAPPAV